MTGATNRRREISRLEREISYYCGVIARTESRDRIQGAHAVIRLRERQLKSLFDSANAGRGDD